MAGIDKNFDGDAVPMPNSRIGFLPQEPHLDPAKDVRGNVEEAVADTMALVNRYNEISDRFAEPMDDEEMQKPLEGPGELPGKIASANAWGMGPKLDGPPRCRRLHRCGVRRRLYGFSRAGSHE